MEVWSWVSVLSSKALSCISVWNASKLRGRRNQEPRSPQKNGNAERWTWLSWLPHARIGYQQWQQYQQYTEATYVRGAKPVRHHCCACHCLAQFGSTLAWQDVCFFVTEFKTSVWLALVLKCRSHVACLLFEHCDCRNLLSPFRKWISCKLVKCWSVRGQRERKWTTATG